MGLSCECDNFEPEDGAVYWGDIMDYALLETKRRRRCCSCKELINLGSLCCKVRKFRTASSEIELKIYGEGTEILASVAYMCERCADIANSLSELGYCDEPWEDQRERAKEYAHEHKQVKE